MDFTLAAPKLLIRDLAVATASGGSISCIGGLRFQRVWIQGVIVAWRETLLAVDDGTAAVELHFPQPDEGRSAKPGMYILVAGAYNQAEKKINVHKLVDLSESPNAESLWNLEVIEAYHMFYKDHMDVMETEEEL